LNSPDVKAKSDAQLANTIAKGQGKMPAYAGKLSDDEIKAAVAYVRSLK
jgi:mono/diheme cytochrome c family protein